MIEFESSLKTALDIGILCSFLGLVSGASDSESTKLTNPSLLDTHIFPLYEARNPPQGL